MRLALLGVMLLAPSLAFGQSAQNRALDATTGSWNPWPMDHATQIPEVETTINGLPPSSANPSPSLSVPTTAEMHVSIVTVTTTATPLPSYTYTNGFKICAANTNAASVELGDTTVTTATGVPIGVNSPIGLQCDSENMANSNQIDVIGTAGDVVYVFGN